MKNYKFKIVCRGEYIKQSLFSFLLLGLIALSLLSLSYAATPNPGHPWTEVGDGNFVATGATTPRIYTFPDTSTTVLTTNALVSVAQGGTGTSSLSGVLIGNGTSAVTATTSPGGLLVGTTATQTLTGKTINASDNIFIDTAAAVGNLLKSNGSKLLNFATTTALSYIRTNNANTDLEWMVLSAGGPAGADTQLQYNNGGSSWGATSSLSISGNVLHVDNMLTLSTTTLPSAPATGTISLFNRLTAGRDMLKLRSAKADDYSVLQSNIFDNYFCMVRATNGTTFTPYGCLISSTGGSAGGATELDGYTVRSTFNSTGTTLATTVQVFLRGTANSHQSGFFYFVRTTLPDTDYTNSSGVRIVYGLSDQTSGNACGSDNVTNQDLIAFNYSTALNANWRIAADDGSASAPTYVDTGVAFTASTTYDFYIYAPPFPSTSTIYWRMDNLTNATTTAEGTATTQLPGASTLLNIQGCFDSVNNTTRNWRIETMYGEVPK